MNHLPFIAGSYAVFLAAAILLSVNAALRLRHTTARLRAVDPRAERHPS
jgi:hypothetical protein